MRAGLLERLLAAAVPGHKLTLQLRQNGDLVGIAEEQACGQNAKFSTRAHRGKSIQTFSSKKTIRGSECDWAPRRARREGDLVTVTEKQDLQQAMAEVVEAAERGAPPGAARALPLQHLITATPLRLKLIPVASEARARAGQRRAGALSGSERAGACMRSRVHVMSS